jgi:hypothetical protein
MIVFKFFLDRFFIIFHRLEMNAARVTNSLTCDAEKLAEFSTDLSTSSSESYPQ